MTVKELIEKLIEFPEDMEVRYSVWDYDKPIKHISKIQTYKNNKEWQIYISID